MPEIAEIIPRQQIESWLAPLLKKRPWLAVSVGIVQDGQQQVEHMGACSADSVFCIASLTKTFTGLALARMALEGTVRLDAPVREHLDPLDLSATSYDEAEITLLGLATHCSGLPRLPRNRKTRSLLDPYENCDAATLQATLRATGLARPQKPKYAYSNFGYGLLGYAMAQAAGMGFAQVLDHYVCRPLGLHNTTLEDPPQLLQGRDLLGLRTPVWHFTDAMAAGGALRSTTADVVRYLQAWLEPPAEMAEAMALAINPVHKIPGGSIGLGWHLNQAGRPWHNGALYGFNSYASFNRKTGRAYVALVNQYTPPHSIADETAANIGRTLRGEATRPITGRPSPLAVYRHAAMHAVDPLLRAARMFS